MGDPLQYVQFLFQGENQDDGFRFINRTQMYDINIKKNKT